MTTIIATTPATTVSVRGTARLEVDPDYGTVSFSVEAEASTSPKALERAAIVADACRAVLADAAGVRRRELGRVRVHERRHWSEQRNRWIADGFAASVSGSTDVDVAAVGRVVGALVDAGAVVGWVGWSLDDDNVAHREVRKHAVAEAHRAAVDFADAVGAPLGPLVTLADAGLLGAGVPDAGPHRVYSAASASEPEPAELDLDPEVQEVFARVEACFTLAAIEAS
jgi:uncharacterized protein YggE